ncbi:universal stress protein [Bombilactobacillus folatiphilus]|uniref:Universal stress protein n=1 Tax=Bombilactobacillus folatiphilus TaxID=2923362 RepID=A0ABY4PAA7_9LACO|nr:universal stress protein [Bombilactobacillus folatiphilus]UQS82683.1 universal stress protein [Bombilactobacillus folatiphilus]
MLQNYQNILVPIDGSYEAETAFNKAIEVAQRNQADLHILHVIDTRAFQDVSSFDSSMVEKISQTAQETINKYEQTALKRGIANVTTTIKYGAPKTTIARTYPIDNQIDLIMIGATGLNTVERLLIGSVTEFVTRNAPCDVMVVRTNLDGQKINHKK